MERVGDDSKGKCGYLVDWNARVILGGSGGGDLHPD